MGINHPLASFTDCSHLLSFNKEPLSILVVRPLHLERPSGQVRQDGEYHGEDQRDRGRNGPNSKEQSHRISPWSAERQTRTITSSTSRARSRRRLRGRSRL